MAIGIRSFVPLLAGVAAVPGRAIRFYATVAGTVTVTTLDGTTDTLTLSTGGDNVYQIQVVSYTAGSATVTSATNWL